MRSPSDDFIGARGICAGGFALAELLLALCCVAVVLAPFVLYLRQAGLLQHEGAERGRSLAWGAYQRQVVGQGIDPSQASHFSVEHPLATGRTVEALGRGETLTQGTAARVVFLKGEEKASGLERNLGAAGFELRAGEAFAPVVVPVQPAQVFTMRPPELNPRNGAQIMAQQLSAGGLRLVAGSSEGGRVVIELSRPGRSATALGSAEIFVSADEWALGIQGDVWVEYPGDESRVQQSVSMEDGRRLWYVEAAGLVSRHMPSERVSLRYTLELGAPVLVLGAVEYASGAGVPVDFRLVTAVRSGRAAVRIQWPDTVRALFSPGLAGLGRFGVKFQAQAGDAGILGRLVFAEESLGNWTARSVLRAEALVPAGCRAETGIWHLERQVMVLPQPRRVEPPGNGDNPESPGWFSFEVAELEGIGAKGRLSARGSSVLGAGGSLRLEVFP